MVMGPSCGLVLADLGAEVIKVEPLAGDNTRRLEAAGAGFFPVFNRNKKSLAIDLQQPQGKDVALRLLRTADVLTENFRPGALEKWGLGWDRLSQLNPGLVMVRLSGYGQTGPYRSRAGFGAIGEAMGGLRYVTGYPDRAPVRVGISLGDAVASLYGVIGALMALRHREVSGGRGQVVDVALYEAVFSLMESLLPEYDMTGFVRERSGASLPGIVPSNTYTTRDGKYVVIGANGDAIFRRMMAAIGRGDLRNDPALARNDGRVARTAELDKVIGAWCAAHDLDHVLKVLAAAQVPSGKIYDIADIVKDLHYQARGMIEEARLPDGEPMKVPGVVPKMEQTPGGTRWLGPDLGEHTTEVLAQLGYDAARIAELKSRGVI